MGNLQGNEVSFFTPAVADIAAGGLVFHGRLGLGFAAQLPLRREGGFSHGDVVIANPHETFEKGGHDSGRAPGIGNSV